MKILKPGIELDIFFSQLRTAKHCALLLDYDGTLAPFRVDPDLAFPYPGIGPLLDSVNNLQHRTLRDKARRNREAVTEAVDNPTLDVPNLEDVIASLWLRSIAAERTPILS